MSQQNPEEYCANNPNDSWCSCYNIINRDCEASPNIPGCKENNEWRDQLVGVIPDKAEFAQQKELAIREMQSRYHCENRACSDDKYRPPEYFDLLDVGRCDFKINICASEVIVGDSVNSKYFRDCSINNMEFQDLDAVYAQDQGVQALLGLRTGENAALIAAKNKQLQLELRAAGREAEADRLAAAEAGYSNRLNAIESIEDAYLEKKEKRKRIILILIAIVIILVIAVTQF